MVPQNLLSRDPQTQWSLPAEATSNEIAQVETLEEAKRVAAQHSNSCNLVVLNAQEMQPLAVFKEGKEIFKVYTMNAMLGSMNF